MAFATNVQDWWIDREEVECTASQPVVISPIGRLPDPSGTWLFSSRTDGFIDVQVNEEI